MQYDYISSVKPGKITPPLDLHIGENSWLSSPFQIPASPILPPPSPISMPHDMLDHQQESPINKSTSLPSSHSHDLLHIPGAEQTDAPSGEGTSDVNMNITEDNTHFDEWTGFGDAGKMDNTRNDAINASQDTPIKKNQYRGRPVGSKNKGKRKATHEVTNTRILRSKTSPAAHATSGKRESGKHDYDMVEVTISPRKVAARPPPSRMREASPKPV